MQRFKSNRRDQLNGSCPFTPSSKTSSTPNAAISRRAPGGE
jgi:hypothetical protein